ncbi:TPA: hypothetical protein HA239_03890 [Candidatus Woesearchaeota archaeon]|nr:hypothetical protein QT06_C0001G0804 [archaeon GW2011_AR15]MBS3103416.1 hypothetical protein [Candidatus Woesearchaeota archaeon]HIH41533.1 hypothetical protein [Candidatus Woesearchaeota archaeon]
MDLKETFKKLKSRNTGVILLIFIIIVLMSGVLRQIFFAAIFIAAAGLSKIYHRFFKSSLGIDLVLYTTLMVSFVYRDIILSLVVGWAGLVVADAVGQKFNYTSFVSVIGLTAVVLLSNLFIGLPLVTSLIALTIVYELIASSLYFMMGSSFARILTFAGSHLLFNLIIITSLTDILRNLM